VLTSRPRTISVRSTPLCPSSASPVTQMLHVAQSLFHDHVSYNLEFGSMGAFADAVDAAFTAAIMR
jgi:hypothetical protein